MTKEKRSKKKWHEPINQCRWAVWRKPDVTFAQCTNKHSPRFNQSCYTGYDPTGSALCDLGKVATRAELMQNINGGKVK